MPVVVDAIPVLLGTLTTAEALVHRKVPVCATVSFDLPSLTPICAARAFTETLSQTNKPVVPTLAASVSASHPCRTALPRYATLSLQHSCSQIQTRVSESEAERAAANVSSALLQPLLSPTATLKLNPNLNLSALSVLFGCDRC